MKDIIRICMYNLLMIYHGIRGLDFIKKDSSVHSSINNGYGFTDWIQIRQIVHFLRNRGMGNYLDKIIDVGCGKGYFIAKMTKITNAKLAGIESELKLINIAKSNFRKLGIIDKVKLYYDDALNFEEYDKYSLIFLYNPFPRKIMREFLDKLISSKQNHSYIIVYVHPKLHEEIMCTGEFTLVGSLYNKLRSQSTNIYLHS